MNFDHKISQIEQCAQVRRLNFDKVRLQPEDLLVPHEVHLGRVDRVDCHAAACRPDVVVTDELGQPEVGVPDVQAGHPGGKAGDEDVLQMEVAVLGEKRNKVKLIL